MRATPRLAGLLLAAALGASGAEAAPRAKTPPKPPKVPAALAPTPTPAMPPAPAPEAEPAAPQTSPPPADALVPALPQSARPLRVAVPEVRAVGDVPARALAALNQSLTPELRKLLGVSAITSSEVRDLLSLERQRQLLGCTDDSSECFAEMAGALDADEMVTLDLTLVGSTYALTSRRLDLRRSKTVQTRLERFERRDGEELLAVVGPMVAALYPDRALRPGRTRGVEASVARRLNPPPLPRWVVFGTGGLGAAAGVAGAVAALLMADAQRQYDALAERSRTELVAGSLLTSTLATASQRAATANALFAVAGGLALAAAVEAFFTDWHDDRAAFAVSPVALGGGGGLAFSLEWR